MNFQSEAKRMQHPQAKLIPASVWRLHIKGDVTDSQIELMKIPVTDLWSRLAALGKQRIINGKLITILCCSYRQPMVSDSDLYLMSNAIELTIKEKLCIAAMTGRLRFLDKILCDLGEEKHLMPDDDIYFAFHLAAEHGHLEIMDKLIDHAKERQEWMILDHRIFVTFSIVASNGHLDVLERLIKLAPESTEEMILDENFWAFREAASNGHLDILKRLIELAPGREEEMIRARNFEAFRRAASNGHLGVLNKLIELAQGSEKKMIYERDFEAFRKAASNGHLDILKRLIELAPESAGEMIRAMDFEAFREAASNGHIEVLKKLIEIAPESRLEMIYARNFKAFCEAASNGYLKVMANLLELVPPEWQEQMIRANDFGAFIGAARNGHLDVLNRLIELTPEWIGQMVYISNFSAFREAARNEHLHVINKLLTFPDVLCYAEQHYREYGQHVRGFIANKLTTLRSRQEAGHPTVVVTQQEATSCLIIMRSLIRERPGSPATLPNIDFLMSIPVFNGILHHAITPNQANELLREAMRLGNRDVVERLLSVPEVLAQAERDGFYPTESRGQLDLRSIAQNRESSVSALSPQEQTMLKRLAAKYQPTIDLIGHEKAFKDVYQAIQDRYLAAPATFVRKNGETVTLPLFKNDFDLLAFTETDNKRALEAYYQHATHTTFRYLSQPNPWMSPNSSYVEVNRATGEQWSTFGSYKDIITLLWMAATDEKEPATEEFTIATRVDELIHEMALIGRAHNWDSTRQKTDKEGKAVVDRNGNSIREEYDDLQGDKPSCYSGVKRRLFQSLKGHPLFSEDIQSVIRLSLQERLRHYMQNQFEKTDTPILEAVLIDYIKLAQGGDSEFLLALSKTWDVSAATLNAWKAELQHHYGQIWGDEDVKHCLDRELALFSKQAESLGYFLAMAENCKLFALCQAALQTRENRLEDAIKTLSPEDLTSFLKETDGINGQSRLLNAIHFGLLGDIGERLESEALAQVLCPDEATAEFYADVLVDYANDPRLERWLSFLNSEDNASLKAMIQKSASMPLTQTPAQNFIMFLRNLDADTPATRSLGKAVFSLKGKEQEDSAPLEALLQPWLIENAADKHAHAIREKIQALGFNIAESSPDEARTSSPSSTNEESRASSRSDSPSISLEGLPDDPTGAILEGIERDERQRKEKQQTTQRYRWHLSNNPTDDQPDPSNGLRR